MHIQSRILWHHRIHREYISCVHLPDQCMVPTRVFSIRDGQNQTETATTTITTKKSAFNENKVPRHRGNEENPD